MNGHTSTEKLEEKQDSSVSLSSLGLVQIAVTKTHINIKCPFSMKDTARSITGWEWMHQKKYWRFPKSPFTALEIAMAFAGKLPENNDFKHLLNLGRDNINSLRYREIGDNMQEIKTALSPPWDHQKRAFWFGLDLPALYLGPMDMGVGKSWIAINLLVARQSKRVIISCPKAVMGVWPREFRKHSSVEYEICLPKARIVRDRVKEAKDFYGIQSCKKRPFAIIINHDAIWRKPWSDFLKSNDFDCIVVDELHRGKSHKGSFGKFLGEIGPFFPRRIGLSGTPLPHSILDAFSQFRFLDPGIYGTSFTKFRDRYCVMGGYERTFETRKGGEVTKPVQVVGFQNLEDFNERFYRISFKAKLREVIKDLPGCSIEERSCDMPKETRKIYQSMEEEFYAQVESGEITASNALVKLLRLQQITSGFAKFDDGELKRLDTAKRELVLDTISDIPMDEPVVIFARFVEDLHSISGIAELLGRNYGEISGARKDLTPDATMPEDKTLMGVQMQSGGLGIDLTRAHYGGFYSAGFSLADYDQCIGRLSRPGQTQFTLLWNFVVNDSIDVTTYRALASRRNAIEAILARRSEEENAEQGAFRLVR